MLSDRDDNVMEDKMVAAIYHTCHTYKVTTEI